MQLAILQQYADKLDALKKSDNFRDFRRLQHQGNEIRVADKTLLNLASNDYLGVAQDAQLRAQFLEHIGGSEPFGSASSRLLTGNFEIYERLEQVLSAQFLGRAALLFNSGYHANIGIVPAICDAKTVILADKLVHASMIDGIRLSGAKCVRYQHNQLTQLTRLVEKYQQDDSVDKILIMTESIFSMDGDEADLLALVSLKAAHPKVLLYVDEAHAIGVRGETGLGCAQACGVIDDIDFIVGAFGKAMGSVGGYVICHPLMRAYLINAMRPLIFSTALPPINVAWSHFVLTHLAQFGERRQRLVTYQTQLIALVHKLGWACPSSSQIVPIIFGENQVALAAANFLQNQGIYAMAVRPPTVPKNQARLRLCLHSQLTETEMMRLQDALHSLKKHIYV